MSGPVPLAVVGMDYREGPTAIRAALVALDAGIQSPSVELIASGAATGIARLETCSRCEWAISSNQPQWAADLLRSALLSRVGAGRHMHVKVGAPAAHYLMRVAAGLESVAEGEPAVGRQVLRGFERSHGESRNDKVLNASWRAVGSLIHHRRALAPSASTVGVHSLVAHALEQRLPAKSTVLVFGQGQIGKAVARVLSQRSKFNAKAFNRATAEQFHKAVDKAPAIVVCSGADTAWLTLPARADKPVAVDIGSPEQILDAPGWDRLALDEMLASSGLELPEDERDALERLVNTSAEALLKELLQPPRAKALEAIDLERKDFLANELPKLLEGLPPREQKRLRASIASFTHSVIKRTRSEL
jgi:glutamyl-tRNA reductase